MSPGRSRAIDETCSISRATSNIMSGVLESCITSPFSRSVICSDIGSPTWIAGTSSGPVGKNVGQFLPASQSVPMLGMSGRKTRSRAVMSLQIV
jgi:hypothetical protein